MREEDITIMPDKECGCPRGLVRDDEVICIPLTDKPLSKLNDTVTLLRMPPCIRCTASLWMIKDDAILADEELTDSGVHLRNYKMSSVTVTDQPRTQLHVIVVEASMSPVIRRTPSFTVAEHIRVFPNEHLWLVSDVSSNSINGEVAVAFIPNDPSA